MRVKIKCPCCDNKIQIILSDEDTGVIASVLPIKEKDVQDIENQQKLAEELFIQKGILLGEEGGEI